MKLIWCAVLLLLSQLALAAQIDIQVTWQAPTENTDGSPLLDLAGYKLYAGETSRNYTAESQVLSDPTATTATFAMDLPWIQEGPGNPLFLAMTAFDADGNESAYSNEIERLFEYNTRPGEPVIITITIQCPPGVQCLVDVP